MRSTILLVLFVSMLLAQSDETKQTVASCDSLMKIEKYDEVLDVTKAYLKDNGKSDDAEYVVPFMMEAYLQQKDYSRFDKLLKNYVKRFPESKKLARLYYLSGIAKAQQGEYVDAVLQLSVSEAYGSSESEKAKVRKNVDLLGSTHLNAVELEQLSHETLAPISREAIAFWYATKMRDEGMSSADSLMALFKQNYPSSTYDFAKAVTTVATPAGKSGEKSIALLAPLTGNGSRLGKEALNSVKLALKEHESRTGEKIKLLVMDTEGSPVVTAQKTAEIIAKKVSAVVGPIMSNTATVTAAMLMDHPEIVMITPTATDDGIAALGKNIFQLNLTTKALAEKIARYSIDNLGIKEFAVLAPISDYGKLMNEYFTEAVQKFGGEVVYSDYFSTSAHDHRAQFEALRNAYVDRVFGKVDSTTKPTRIEMEQRQSYFEDTTIAIGGLFIPATAENAVKLAAEVPFYKIQTQLLGSNGWKKNTLILDGDKYVNGAVISTGYSAGSNNTEWVAFKESYNKAYGAMPGKMVAPLVYDATELLVKALQNSTGSKDISRKLWVTAGYQGLSGEISLDNEAGVNGSAVIMKVSGGKFIRLQ